MRAIILLLLFIIALPLQTLAADLTIRPFLVDVTMVPRESTTETILIENNYDNRNATVYATVNEISVGTDGAIKEFITPVMTDRTNTVTSWIKISRGRVVIPPNESAEVPLTISIHPFAEPGEYHVFVGFVSASKRAIADETALRGDAQGVIVKITVADERIDAMRITSMVVDRIVSREDERKIDITVENSGDIESSPQGELVFYDGRGREVRAVPVNEAGESISPNSEKTFTVTIPFDQDIGRFKANVNLLYGENQRANLYDTTSFFMLPLHYLLLLIGFFVVLIIILLILMHNRRDEFVSAEDGDEVSMYIRDGHAANPQDHDIDLSKK
jgi:hypothetical protein